MSEQKQSKGSTAASIGGVGGIGVILTAILNGMVKDEQSKLVLGAAVPFAAAFLNHLLAIFIAYFGGLTPEQITTAARFNRDKRRLKKALQDPLLSEEAKRQAQQDYDQTVLNEANLGKTLQPVKPAPGQPRP
ncbi:hypothetical protein [Gallaecimonas mangrovi]|uniref:hypothetical protein n=1 Tax=Gallaecimonas mangrovi TaxID=2291597 RepID=UPI000E20578A|nr:hypothetical protein [Gallaecimonas mangrovi]